MISKNVMKTHEFKDSIFYKMECACGSSKDIVTIEFEKYESHSDMILLNFYKYISWRSYRHINIFYNFWERIKCAIKVLFTGYVELEGSFLIQGEESINSIIEALEEGKEYVKGINK